MNAPAKQSNTMSTQTPSNPDQKALEKALNSPDESYPHPEDVLRSKTLSDADKHALLVQWKNDLEARSEATAEGMEVDADASVPGTVLMAVSSALLTLEERFDPAGSA